MKLKEIFIGALLLCNCQLTNSASATLRVEVAVQDNSRFNLLLAQVTPDDTLGGESSTVEPNAEVQGVTADLIEGGAERGANLFHSFEEFNVGDGQSVYFANPEGITNILSRVTGSDVSDILGTLGVNGGADLFLINPNGIIFGENASLDVNGSFIGTTADAIQFSEQGFFNVTEPNAPRLLTVNPSALFFNQMSGEIIENRSTAPAGFNILQQSLSGLRVPNEESLLLVGGEIVVDGGGLHALDGRVELLGIAEEGIVELNTAENKLTLNLPSQLQLADISITGGAFINTSNRGSGEISLRGKNIDITDESFIFADTLENVDGKGILIEADNLLLNNGSRITTDVVGSGRGGNITIDTKKLNIQGSTISSSVFGQGNGGNISINATEILSVDSGFIVSEIFSNSNIEANEGDINLATASFSLTNGSIVSTTSFGQGDSGNININATETVSVIRSLVSATSFGQSNSGNININATKTVSLVEGASLSSNIASGAKGRAGNIVITANDVVFDGGFAISRLEAGAEGSGGNIDITSDSLLVTGISTETAENNVGQLVTASFGQGDAGNLTIKASGDVIFDGSGSDVFNLIGGNLNSPNPPAQGNAGDITIDSSSLSVKNQARLIGSVEGIGNAGNISINTKSLSIFNEGQILTDVANTGIGDAGNIKIVAESVDVTNRGRLSASTALTGNGGNLILEIADLLLLRNNASISTTAGIEGAGGNGGNIEIDANFVIAFPLENSDITANAFEGNGGNITIDVESIFGIEERPLDDTTNDINASSEFGLSGTVEIDILEVNPIEDSLDVPVTPVETKVAQSCEPNSDGNRSEFVVTGRGGVPDSPEDSLTNGFVLEDWRVEEESFATVESERNFLTAEQEKTEPIIEANSWTVDEQGKVTLVANKEIGASNELGQEAEDCQANHKN